MLINHSISLCIRVRHQSKLAQFSHVYVTGQKKIHSTMTVHEFPLNAWFDLIYFWAPSKCKTNAQNQIH